ncbi:hypothetical protein [Dongia deserti]|uniref:hypothetical protein n=1 Tax=Dongia deserti TaxID=2268030 RepID=UPI000E64DED9|nr:hypothetical protein [Dongia deserti]
MRFFPLLVRKDQFRVGLQSLLAGLFPILTRYDDVRNLPPYLLRDIGLSERRDPDWDRLLT